AGSGDLRRGGRLIRRAARGRSAPAAFGPGGGGRGLGRQGGIAHGPGRRGRCGGRGARTAAEGRLARRLAAEGRRLGPFARRVLAGRTLTEVHLGRPLGRGGDIGLGRLGRGGGGRRGRSRFGLRLDRRGG